VEEDIFSPLFFSFFLFFFFFVLAIFSCKQSTWKKYWKDDINEIQVEMGIFVFSFIH
jgi:hypothetical protein